MDGDDKTATYPLHFKRNLVSSFPSTCGMVLGDAHSTLDTGTSCTMTYCALLEGRVRDHYAYDRSYITHRLPARLTDGADSFNQSKACSVRERHFRSKQRTQDMNPALPFRRFTGPKKSYIHLVSGNRTWFFPLLFTFARTQDTFRYLQLP